MHKVSMTSTYHLNKKAIITINHTQDKTELHKMC